MRVVALKRWTSLSLAAALAATLAVPPASATAPADLVPVVVSAFGDAARAVAAVADAGGSVSRVVELIDGAVATVPADQVDDLEADARIRAVVPDVEVRMQSADGVSSEDHTSTSDVFRATIGADAVATSGAGVRVGLLDTGISTQVEALDDKVVASADLTEEGNFTDTYGHGTFMASLVSAVAPGAEFVSVKVAGADGVTSLGQVLYGLQLLDAARTSHGVSVVSLAIAAPRMEGLDPLEIAVERLWANGLVVIAAAGNDGELASPGDDPYVVTVGALAENGTADRSDDTVADWSGEDASIGKPEIVAPGVRLLGLRAPGSTIDGQVAVDDSLPAGTMRGSGTSMSVAVTAGAVALLLESEGALSPNEVKGRLMAAGADTSDDVTEGKRSLDLRDAVAADGAVANGAPLMPLPDPVDVGAPADPDNPKARSFGWHEFDGRDLWMSQGWAKQAQRQGLDSAARYWAARYWAARYWADASWAARYWASSDFVARYWAARYWADTEWGARYWADGEFAARYWADSEFAARYWADSEFAARYWADGEWSARYWADRTWQARYWADSDWAARYWAGRYWAASDWS